MSRSLTPAARKDHSISFAQRPHRTRKHKLTPLALAGLLLCGAAHAGESVTFDAEKYPEEPSYKLLKIRDTENSLGPVNQHALANSENPDEELKKLLDQRHSDNQIRVISGTIGGHVYGAAPSEKIDAANNQVLIEGGEISQSVYGAHTSRQDASASRNQITITGGKISGSSNGAVFGGYSTNGSVEGNSVLINGTSAVIERAVYGGAANANANRTLSASNNSITVTAGTVKDQIIGGLAPRGSTTNGKAEGNRVLINGADAHIAGAVTGGNARDAVSNTVTISAGKITGDVIGGYSPANRSHRFNNPQKIQLKNNKVVIEGTPEFIARKAGPGSSIDVLPTLYG